MSVLAGLFRLFTDEDRKNSQSQSQKLDPDNRNKTTEERLDELLRNKEK